MQVNEQNYKMIDYSTPTVIRQGYRVTRTYVKQNNLKDKLKFIAAKALKLCVFIAAVVLAIAANPELLDFLKDNSIVGALSAALVGTFVSVWLYVVIDDAYKFCAQSKGYMKVELVKDETRS